MDQATTQQLMGAAEAQAKASGLDANLVLAICAIESSWNPLAARFEPAFKYFNEPNKWAASLGISVETETMFQACSWGLMQIMGSAARDLGYTGPMQQLCSMWLGTEFGCRKLEQLQKKYPDERDVIAAYNAGSPRRIPESGNYVNQSYVDAVSRKLNELRSIK